MKNDVFIKPCALRRKVQLTMLSPRIAMTITYPSCFILQPFIGKCPFSTPSMKKVQRVIYIMVSRQERYACLRKWSIRRRHGRSSRFRRRQPPTESQKQNASYTPASRPKTSTNRIPPLLYGEQYGVKHLPAKRQRQPKSQSNLAANYRSLRQRYAHNSLQIQAPS